ncbi:hypothetical protein ONZ43_g1232 [Nemania bipapillata]|uniref:Uncharacterized protein n=1 Tax=Nemania bipapillata TaxID=110536 RepID=A0ACC2J5D0_9PEZI|nr:hypothetical protein ONZ43_g1232 [Nemania bipapillata]
MMTEVSAMDQTGVMKQMGPATGEHGSENTGPSSSSSRLEDLPAELRVLILSAAPDLLTLRALVRASPVLHAQYRNDRMRILRACMDREMDGLLVDAYATVMSRAGKLGERTDQTITDFLDLYKSWLSGSMPVLDIKTIRPSRLRWMAAYHISVARPLALSYGNWALTNLERAVLSSTGQQGATASDIEEAAAVGGEEHRATEHGYDIELSRSEEIRIFRALYRHETYHHLFGQNTARRVGAFRHHEVHALFFCLFDPWEAEAVGCIDTFVRAAYGFIFDQIWNIASTWMALSPAA